MGIRVEDITPGGLKELDEAELYQLRFRAIQIFEKGRREARLRKRKGEGEDDPVFDMGWRSLMKKYSMLMKEFDKRRIFYDQHNIDKARLPDFYIRVLGTMAQPDSEYGPHFALLIHHEDMNLERNILVDPAVMEKNIQENVTHIIITQADEDHWTYLDEYPAKGSVQVFSSGAIIDHLPRRKNIHPMLKALLIPGITIHPIKMIQKSGSPSMGFRLNTKGYNISVIPELLHLGETARETIAGTIWIVGCADFEKDDDKTGKLSFSSLMDLAEGLEPKALYLTNLSGSILDKRKEVNHALERWGGRILLEQDSLSTAELRKGLGGIYLVPPHGQLIFSGGKKLIIKSREYKSMVGKQLIVVSQKLAYGVIQLSRPERISLKEFGRLRSLHKISDMERKKWWPDKTSFYKFPFRMVSRYKDARPVRVPPGTQTFLNSVYFRKAGGLTWGLAKPAYRIFQPADLGKTAGFKGPVKMIVEAKFDGVRTKIVKKDGKVVIFTDPEDTATPNKTKRLPWQVKELEKMKQDDFALDAELVMVKEGEVLHRTTVNALINGKFDPTEQSKGAHLYVFDVLESGGQSIKTFPLKERKEELAKYADTEHVHFVRPKTALRSAGLSFVVDSVIGATKAIGLIMKASPKFISEGAMMKLLGAPYSGRSWVKWKEKFEIDCLVVGKYEIKKAGKQTGSYNYGLAVGPLPRAWAEAILRKDKNAIVEYKGKKYNYLGKSDNTKQNVSVGSILRVASEDVNKFETDAPDRSYYKAYISVVMQPVPEKKSPDGIYVVQRLSEMTPRRERMKKKTETRPSRAIAGIQSDVKDSKDAGKMSKEVYRKYARENEPLPAPFYTNYREGEAWAQTHIRGLEPEELEEYNKKQISLAELFEGHSIHIDLRMKLGQEKLIQWVILDNDIPSYLRFLTGELRETRGGTRNVQHSMAVVKPSAEQERRVKKAEEDSEEGMKTISAEGARKLAAIQIIGQSYIIPAGEIGATSNKPSWMGLIWSGRVKAGIQRKDYHEYFLHPGKRSGDKNGGGFFDGKFVVKCLKRGEGDRGARWEVWEAVTNPLPTDPVEHKDGGYYFPVKASEVRKFGKEHYEYGKKEPV